MLDVPDVPVMTVETEGVNLGNIGLTTIVDEDGIVHSTSIWYVEPLDKPGYDVIRPTCMSARAMGAPIHFGLTVNCITCLGASE